MIMFGVFTFWLFGVIDWLWPRIVRRKWASDGLRKWHFWLSTIGIFVMFFDLTMSGLIHGFMQRDLNPWTDIIEMSVPFWWVRTFAGGMFIAGLLCMLYNMYCTSKGDREYVEEDYLVASETD